MTFVDASKKKLVTRCRQCIYASMVEKRKLNGSYTQSEERKQKQSDLMKKLRQNGDFISDEGRRKLSENLKSRWMSDEYRQRVKSSCIEKYGKEHWTQTEEGRKCISQRSKKYRASDQTKLKMRISASKRIREGRNAHPFRGRGGHRDDISLYVRSRWEANFARYLKHTNQDFEYEKHSFVLSDGRTYTPDFKVGNKFYEVKGWWTAAAKEKFEIFKETYPEVEVQIIDEIGYGLIQERYASSIPTWEYK